MNVQYLTKDTLIKKCVIMIDALQDTTLNAGLVEREDAKHNKSQVTHARICHQLLHICLRKRNDRAVDDANYGQHSDQRCVTRGGFRKER